MNKKKLIKDIFNILKKYKVVTDDNYYSEITITIKVDDELSITTTSTPKDKQLSLVDLDETY